MSTQIQYTVENLYKKKLIISYNILGHENARIWVDNDTSLHIFVVDDRYEISIADIKAAVATQPDYLVCSNWQGITSAAQKEIQDSKLVVISYGKLCYILEDMVKPDESEESD